MDALRDLDFFVQLCRAGSLSAAARALEVSPAATSKRLAALEKRLGVQLLNRNTRSMSLTPDGALYLEEARRIGEHVRALETQLATHREAVSGVLRVNASLGFGRKYLAAMVAHFIAAHPAVEVQMHLSDHPLDLVAASFDIGIRFGELPDSTLHARRIAAHRRLICAAPAYLARRGTPQDPQALADHDCLVLRQNDDTHVWHFFRAGAQHSVRVHGPMSSNDGESIVAWALAGFGVIQRAAWEVAPHIADGTLVELLTGYALPGADISAVYPDQRFVPPKVRAFIDFFGAYVQSADLAVARKTAT